jgi:hypothetical protein
MRNAGCLLLLGLLACDRDLGRSPPPGSTPEERCASWVANGLAVEARTRATLEQELGPPRQTQTATGPNRHIPDGVDSIITVHYPGIVFALRKPPEGGDLLETAVVSDDRWLRWTDPGIGSSANRIIEILGAPAERSDSLYRYTCGTGIAEEPVSISIADQRVAEIVFEFYVD